MIRLAVLNFAGACFLAWAWWLGFTNMVTAADPFHITYAIGAVFLAGVAFTFRRMWVVSRLPRYSTEENRREGRKATIRNRAVADVVESLAMLGLVGSALGLLYAFGGVSESALGTPDGIKDAAIHVLMGVKLLAGATLAGISLALWMVWNNRMLETATALYNEDIS